MAEDGELNIGDRVHLIAGHMDGEVTGFAPRPAGDHRATVPGAWVLWDGAEQSALWALYELEPVVR